MDIFTPIGMIISLGAVVFGIIFLGGKMGDFLDPASALLVIIPTFGALFIAFPGNMIAKIGQHMAIILGLKKFDPVSYVELMTRMAETARASGLMALEAEAASSTDDFVKTALQMAADAAGPEKIEERLNGLLDAVTKRHNAVWGIYDKGASFAPAFGMAATVVSLVNMLMSLDFSDAGGVSSLGQNMSAAMITTLYGSLLANVFFMPLGNKLRVRHQDEMMSKQLVVSGIVAISRGDNVRDVRDMLIERLDPKLAKKIAK